MKDPEKFGGTESVAEDLDDMLVEAGDDTVKLELLLEFFLQMVKISDPFTNKNTGEITAPNNRIPIEELPKALREKIDNIDGAFAETMSYTEWIQIFEQSIKKIKQKLSQASSSLSYKLK